MSMQSPDVNCDVCGDGIIGPVWVRGDLVVCKACAHAINSNDPTAWPHVYHTIYLWPMATVAGIVVLYVPMIPIFTLLVGAVAVFCFLLGVLKALK